MSFVKLSQNEVTYSVYGPYRWHACLSVYYQFMCSWLLQPSCSVVTPNKQLGAGPQKLYSSVMKACQQTGNQFYYEVFSTSIFLI